MKRILTIIITVSILISSIIAIKFVTYAESSTVTWNPNDSEKGTTVFSDGNLTVSSSGVGTYDFVRATLGKITGKWYWELNVTTAYSCDIYMGIATATHSPINFLGDTTGGISNFRGLYVFNEGIQYSIGAEFYSSNNIIGVALDLDNKTIDFYKDGQFIYSTNVNINDEVFAAVGFWQLHTGNIITANFGDSEFVYTIPTGYLPYNENGIPAPTPEPTVTPTPIPTSNAMLKITMAEEIQKEYKISTTEVNSFITWYDNRLNGTGKGYYIFYIDKDDDPYSSRKEYIMFDKIICFEVMEY